MPAPVAMLAMPLPVCRVEPRLFPVSRSGCVTSPTTVSPAAINASNVGSANVPVPIITIRILLPAQSFISVPGGIVPFFKASWKS